LIAVCDEKIIHGPWWRGFNPAIYPGTHEFRAMPPG
jgi:hypothetical protein